ncbi:MAG: YceI family protein [Bacteroidales bacterium]
MKKSLLILGMLGFLFAGHAQKPRWKADTDHTRIGFSAMFMGVSRVEGRFADYDITVHSDKEDFSDAEASVTIRAESIDTDNDKRDEDLRGESFLYVEKYPEITFKSSTIEVQDGDFYRISGELTIRGITRTESFELEYKGLAKSSGQTRAAFQLSGSINRFDYDVDWNESFIGGLVVSREVKIDCDVTLIRDE